EGEAEEAPLSNGDAALLQDETCGVGGEVLEVDVGMRHGGGLFYMRRLGMRHSRRATPGRSMGKSKWSSEAFRTWMRAALGKPRRCAARWEKSGSWPTSMMRSKWSKLRNSSRARSGCIPQ